MCAKQSMRILSVFMAALLFFVSSFPVYATGNVKDLEKETSKLESDLSDLNDDLEGLGNELDELLIKIEETSSNLEKTREELAIAKGKEEAQYKAMTLRIKYMYENGNLGLIQNLLSSSCIAEFIDRAESIVQITKYDRKQLDELTALREEIAKQEATLSEDIAYLASLQNDLDAKETLLKEKIASTSSDLSTYTAKLEQARADAEQAQNNASNPVTPIPPSGGNSNSGSSGDSNSSIAATADDITLLAALIECEAGSTHYEGMLAVGSVVVNRMKHRYYPDTLRGVIYQRGQFPPATNGSVDRILARGVRQSCVQAATDALNGKNNVGSCLSFRSASSGFSGTIIGGNVFF